jgi:hypothetical protein
MLMCLYKGGDGGDPVLEMGVGVFVIFRFEKATIFHSNTTHLHDDQHEYLSTIYPHG